MTLIHNIVLIKINYSSSIARRGKVNSSFLFGESILWSYLLERLLKFAFIDYELSS